MPGGSTGRFLFDAALAGGAAALGKASKGIVAGARADIVSLDAGDARLEGKQGDRILDAWIFAAGSAAVDAVWAGGRKVVQGGRHAGREPIRRRYSAALSRLAGRL